MPTKLTKIYQLKIVLQGSKPPIWRRIQVQSNITLDVLHQIIQTTMGWYNSHLHQFDIHGTFYSSPAFQMEETEDESRIKLDRVLTRPQSKFSYEYDFGDGWEHQIVLEKVLPVEPETQYPCCIKGKRNCPPEDIGGIWGYQNFVAAVQDENHPEHAESLEQLEWIGGDFDPEWFDLVEINEGLADFV
jgi:Plasmid pRiA4b ORF-3-like protein